MHRIAVTFNYQLSIINCQFLVDKVIFLRAEAWKGCACATWKWLADIVATLGHDLENIYLRSRIAQNIFLHNAFEIKLLNYSVNYCAGVGCGVVTKVTVGFVAKREQPP